MFGGDFFGFEGDFFVFDFVGEGFLRVKMMVLVLGGVGGNEAGIVGVLVGLGVAVAGDFLIFEGETHMISILFIVFE